MTAAGRPTIDHGDNHLGHGADKALDLEDMQATALHLFAGGVHGGFIRGGVIMGVLGGVAVAGAAANALVAAGTKRPAAVLFGRAIAGEQNRAHIRRAAGMVQGAVELVYGMRAKRIAHLRAVEGDAHDAVLAALAVEPVIGDIRQVLKPFYGMPQFRPERIIGAVLSLLAHKGQLSGKRRIVPIPNPHPHTLPSRPVIINTRYCEVVAPHNTRVRHTSAVLHAMGRLELPAP